MNSGDLQPLICIVNITIAQVFPSEAETQHRPRGNLLGEAGRGVGGRGRVRARNQEQCQHWTWNRWRGSGQFQQPETGFGVSLVYRISRVELHSQSYNT